MLLQALVEDQATKKEELRLQAEADQHAYDALNYRDDQFDLSRRVARAGDLAARPDRLDPKSGSTGWRWSDDRRRLMGLAGLLGWHLHPAALVRLLS